VTTTCGNAAKEPTMQSYRQGDVLLLRVDHIPDDAKKRTGKGALTIAYGEVTGHHHTLVGDGIEVLVSEAEEVFARIMSSADLVHQEHATITLEPGLYKYVPQREYVAPEMERRVLD
jgi:hypothetical protein